VPEAERDAIEMMERCHRKLSERAEELVALVGQGDDEAVAETLDFFSKVTRRHFADEEQSIFPRLSEADAALASRLTQEHRAHEALLDELRGATQGEGGDVVALARRWSEELSAHAAREDEELLPLLKAMDEAAIDAITAEMKARRGGGGGRRGGGGGGGGSGRRGG